MPLVTFAQAPRSDPNVRWFAPGVLRSAAVLAALLAGKIVQLTAGDYLLDAPIPMTPSVAGPIRGPGASMCRIKRGYAAPSGRDDDPTNALISARGVIDTSVVNTTITSGVPAYAGLSTISLTANGLTPAVGSKLFIAGNNSAQGTQEPDMSDTIATVVSEEIVEVLSVTSTGGHTIVTLKRPLLTHHSDGVAVKGVSVCQGAEVSGVSLGTAGDTVAVGFFSEYATDVDLCGVDGVGFTRSVVDFEHGSMRVSLNRIRGRGGNNGLVYMSALHQYKFRDLENTAEGDRYHPTNGVTRALITSRWHCSSGSIIGTTLRHGTRGVEHRGVLSVLHAGTYCEDMDPTIALPVAQGGGGRDTDFDNIGYFGVGFGLVVGKADGSEIEHGASVEIGDVTCVDCRTPFTYIGHAICIVDAGNLKPGYHAGSLVVGRNSGVGASGAVSCNGVCLVDTIGHIDAIYTRGVNNALSTLNTQDNSTIGTLTNVTSGGNATQYAIMMRQSGGAGCAVRIAKFRNYGASAPSLNVYVDSTWAAAPDFKLAIEDVETNINGSRAFNCMLFSTDGGTYVAGDVVQIDGGAGNLTPRVKAVSTADTTASLAVVAIGSPDLGGQAYVLATPLPGRGEVMCTGAVNVGDALSMSATTGRLKAQTTFADPRALKGRAMSGVASGGLIRCAVG